jgi:hypothetical protein
LSLMDEMESVAKEHVDAAAPAGHRAPEESRDDEALRREVKELRQALESHPVIDLARGIVMALGPCSPEEAWGVLVEVSQHTNTKLREIAQHLVDSVGGPQPPKAVRLELSASLERLRVRRRDRT